MIARLLRAQFDNRASQALPWQIFNHPGPQQVRVRCRAMLATFLECLAVNDRPDYHHG